MKMYAPAACMRAWKAKGSANRGDKARKLSVWRAAEWRHGLHVRSARTGTNLETAAHLPDSFAHSRDTNADPLQTQDSVFQIAGNPVTLIADLHHDFLGIARDANRRRPAAGMMMDVRKAFLHDPKQHQLQLLRQPPQAGGDFQ